MQKINILEVDICVLDMTETINEVESLLEDGKQHYFVTPNPEIILKAQNDKEYQAILNKASLQTADGIGLLWAARHLNIRQEYSGISKYWRYLTNYLCLTFAPFRLREILPERVTGVELMKNICQLASKKNQKVFLLGSGEGVAEETKDILEKTFPGLKVSGTFAGSPRNQDAPSIVKAINQSDAEILFVAYGAPDQEVWIAEQLKRLPRIKMAGGVGGAFDFIAGRKKRAPKWMRKINIEWLFRLLIQPSRWKRIFNATIKFPWKVITS